MTIALQLAVDHWFYLYIPWFAGPAADRAGLRIAAAARPPPRRVPLDVRRRSGRVSASPRPAGGQGGTPGKAGCSLKRLVAVVAVLVLSTCGALAATLAAAAKPARKPNLRVSKLSSPPASAKAGDAFDVSGKVANAGEKRGNTRLRVSLRTDKGADPVAQLLSLKVKVAPEGAKRFAQTAFAPGRRRRRELDRARLRPRGRLPARRLRPPPRQARGGALPGLEGADEDRAAAGPAGRAAAPNFTPGARTLGDPLLPQIGNGGYDALHYDIDLDYDRPDEPVRGRDGDDDGDGRPRTSPSSASTSRTCRSTGSSSTAPRRRSTRTTRSPTSRPTPQVTQPMKLVVIPAAGILSGKQFTVEVDYHGEPQVFTDPDFSIEGWIPACFTVSPVETCNSNFVVGEPMGSQAWFPSNNFPSDKATFDTSITVQGGDQAFGLGELTGPPVDNGDGTTTWSWSEDDPTATYLATASNGNFDLHRDDRVRGADGPHAADLQRDRPDREPRADERLRHPRRAQLGADRLLRRALRPLPVRLLRRDLRPHDRDRLRARGPGQVALLEPSRARSSRGRSSARTRSRTRTSSRTCGWATPSRSATGTTSGSTRAGRSSRSGSTGTSSPATR